MGNFCEEIERIAQAKSDIINSIENKGVTVPEGTIVDELPEYIDRIEGCSVEMFDDSECFWVDRVDTTSGAVTLNIGWLSGNTMDSFWDGEMFWQITDPTDTPQADNWVSLLVEPEVAMETGNRLWIKAESTRLEKTFAQRDTAEESIPYQRFTICCSESYTRFNVGGNLRTLYSMEKSKKLLDYTFYNIFSRTSEDGSVIDTIQIVDASELILPDAYYEYNIIDFFIVESHPQLHGLFERMFFNQIYLESTPYIQGMGDLSEWNKFIGPFCMKEMFKGCTSLVTVNGAIPAIGDIGAFESMFEGCTSLENHPLFYDYLTGELPDGLEEGVYVCTISNRDHKAMFKGCTSLSIQNISYLGDLYLTGVFGTGFDDGYTSMYEGCTNLTDNMKIKLSTVYGNNFNGKRMFYGCTNLDTVLMIDYAKKDPRSGFVSSFGNCKEMFAYSGISSTVKVVSNTGTLTTFGNICLSLYENLYVSMESMYEGCENLNNPLWFSSQSKILGYNGTHDGVFKNMFKGCTSLTDASSIQWLYMLYPYAYSLEGMFEGCINLVNINSSMLAGDGTNVWPVTVTTLPEGYCKNMFKGCERLDESVIIPSPITDIGTQALYGTYYGTAINNTRYYKIFANKWHFNSIMDYGMQEMFRDCSNLISTFDIQTQSGTGIFRPTASTYGIGCFMQMFYGCIGLEQLPMPTVTLSQMGATQPYQYAGMFESCTSLKEGQARIQTYVRGVNSYSHRAMFAFCTSLSQVSLPTNITVAAEGCFQNMYTGCTSLVEWDNYEGLNSWGSNFTTLAKDCFKNMFYGCSNFTNTTGRVALGDARLVEGCYEGMFQNCSKLQYIKYMGLDCPDTLYTKDMVKDVNMTPDPATGIAGEYHMSPNADWYRVDEHSIPSDTLWTVIKI